MRAYEVIFILDPALADDGVESAITAAKGVVTKEGGEVAEIQKWGKKRLAYEIKKRREGHYVFFRIAAPPKAVGELERYLKIAESVLKYMTVVAETPGRRFGKAKAKTPVAAETAVQEA
ncbi:MAG TPA: 30S ribosomal protein S6 [Candidatus Methylomirabilis sp.]|nr:30S ribosomal protein S6 [Candidatus Methylomirabilis sp.]